MLGKFLPYRRINIRRREVVEVGAMAGLSPRKSVSIPGHSYGIRNGRCCGGTGFYSSTSFFPCHYSLINLFIHRCSFIHHWRYLISAIDSTVKWRTKICRSPCVYEHTVSFIIQANKRTICICVCVYIYIYIYIYIYKQADNFHVL